MELKKFFLIDGSSFLYRAYYGSSYLTTKSGTPTGAIYGVLSMFKSLLNVSKSDLLAVVFDPKGPTMRNDWFSDYKANRTKMPDDLQVQISPLKDIIHALGYPLVEKKGIEADDIIGTLAKKAEKMGFEVIIFSGDKDMAQLVTDRITVIDQQKKSVWNREGVKKKFGVSPEQIIDYLTLIGDVSDNIPGVAKVGPKTAVKWLDKYGSLDNIIKKSAEISGKVGENLRSAISDLPLSKRLVTIITDLDIDFTNERFSLKPSNEEELLRFYEEFEFKSLIAELNQSEGSKVPKIETTPSDYVAITEEIKLLDLAEKIRKNRIIAIDLETTSLDNLAAKIVGFSISVEKGVAVYIPVGHSGIKLGDQLPIDLVLRILSPLLEDETIKKIGHNLKYDYSVLLNYKVTMRGIFSDTMLQSYVCNSTASRHDMDSVAKKALDISTISYDDVTKAGKNQICFSQVPIDIATKYAAEDADVSFRLYEHFTPIIKKTGNLSYVLNNIEIPLIKVLAKMERKGVLINSEMLFKQSEDLETKISGSKDLIFKMSGYEFNISSPKQIQELLYEKLNIPVLAKTPKGQPSTSENVLKELSLHYELPKLILEYRSLTKLKSTYTDKLPSQINQITGRVHTSYHQAVTATGRLSSSDPNLQNIPIKSIEGRKIRSAFVPPPGKTLVAADYSQIELRIMAHLSKDENLISSFSNGVDIHSATAAEVFGGSADKVSTENRRAAKAINFGLIYGMSAFGLAKQLEIGRSEAQRYIDLYFRRYTKVKDYMERIKAKAKDSGWVETLCGRRLYLPNINAKKASLRQYAERTAINAPMQGTAADIIKLAMISADDWLSSATVDAELIMQVHDELVFEVANDQLVNFIESLKVIMESCITLDVPLKVSIGKGNSWDAAH